MTTTLLVLIVTTDCTLRCRYCYACGGEDPEYMPREVARRSIEAASALAKGTRLKVQFAGGEPTMHMSLVRQVAGYASGRHTLQMQTNAVLVDRDVAAQLRSLGIAVGVSLDGPPVVNDYLRPSADGSGSTAAVLAGIDQLRRAGLSVGMTSVLSASNVASLPLLLEVAAYLGNIRGISLDSLRPLGRAARGEVAPADPAEAYYWVTEALRRADALAAMGGPSVTLREFERMRRASEACLPRDNHCYFDAGISLAVMPNGDAYPCASLMGLPHLRLGNVLDADFAALLPSHLRQARSLIHEPERCLRCPDRLLCGGACPASLCARHARGQLTECSVKRACLDHLGAGETAGHPPRGEVAVTRCR